MGYADEHSPSIVNSGAGRSGEISEEQTEGKKQGEKPESTPTNPANALSHVVQLAHRDGWVFVRGPFSKGRPGFHEELVTSKKEASAGMDSNEDPRHAEPKRKKDLCPVFQGEEKVVRRLPAEGFGRRVRWMSEEGHADSACGDGWVQRFASTLAHFSGNSWSRTSAP